MINEKYLEKKLTEGLHALGVWCEKYTNPFKTGYPDRICIEKTGKVSWVEVKTPGEKLRPLQEERKRELEGYGCPVYVVDSEETLRSVLECFAPPGSTCIVEASPDEINTATIAGVQRRFPAWTILKLESCHIRQSDGTYIYATVDNYQDPKDPHPYHAEIIREIDTGFGPDFEHLKGRSFDDLIEALLYLESVDLGEHETTNE